MATAETVSLGPTHPPREEAIEAFNTIEVDLKKTLRSLRHETNKHEPAYFAAVENLSDRELTNFSANDLQEVRIGTSAYGMHLFGKVLLEKGTYFMFRAFVTGGGETAKLHCIHMEEIENQDETRNFRAIFTEDDSLEWFDM